MYTPPTMSKRTTFLRLSAIRIALALAVVALALTAVGIALRQFTEEPAADDATTASAAVRFALDRACGGNRERYYDMVSTLVAETSEPSWRSPQACHSPTLMAAKRSPAGGLPVVPESRQACAAASLPSSISELAQHTGDPSSRSAQAWDSPTLTAMNAPSGGGSARSP